MMSKMPSRSQAKKEEWDPHTALAASTQPAQAWAERVVGYPCLPLQITYSSEHLDILSLDMAGPSFLPLRFHHPSIPIVQRFIKQANFSTEGFILNYG